MSVYDDLENATPAWTRTYSPVVVNYGYASLQVTGQSSAGVDLDEFDFSRPVYLGVAVGQVTLGERQPVGRVPRVATSASGPAGTSAGAPATSCLSLRDSGDSDPDSDFLWSCRRGEVSEIGVNVFQCGTCRKLYVEASMT